MLLSAQIRLMNVKVTTIYELYNWGAPRLSPSHFVFCVKYGYCMNFGKTASPDSVYFQRLIPLTPEC